MIKSYNEFLKTLSPERLVEIANSASANADDLKIESSLATSLGNQVAGISLTFTIEILRLYHEWLSEQL